MYGYSILPPSCWQYSRLSLAASIIHQLGWQGAAASHLSMCVCLCVRVCVCTTKLLQVLAREALSLGVNFHQEDFFLSLSFLRHFMSVRPPVSLPACLRVLATEQLPSKSNYNVVVVVAVPAPPFTGIWEKEERRGERKKRKKRSGKEEEWKRLNWLSKCDFTGRALNWSARLRPAAAVAGLRCQWGRGGSLHNC